MSSSDEDLGQAQLEAPLSVDPEVATFTAAGGKSEHMLVNLGDTHLAVKVRCSNDSLYRVTPVYQVVETGQCKSLVVTRSVGPPGLDRLTIQYLPTTDINCNIIEIFNNAMKSGMKINALKLILKMKEETNFSDDATYI
uniref:Major sperm protein n=1 Tax=Angiostrongylus cantonensis TaxID=6313 RepID=A0A0K0DHE1_ANGCA